ncbi:tRNA lysidine(34) synthetase TilS [Longimonas halophila]|nr:tRNA lysidine(34) synthetase TilS [Longimonas halophila]
MSIRDAVASVLADAEVGTAPVVVGVSGGIDSMVLAHALAAEGARGVIVHVNYGLRPSADADTALVQDWAARHVPNWPVVVHRPDTLSGNTQDAARRVRYAEMHRVARAHGSRTVLVAHHQRDQVETVLLHLLRGTGPRGLAGMPRSRLLQNDPDVRLWRPLLHTPKADIEAYAEAHRVPYRADPTNTRADYTRNRLRHEVLPVLRDIASDAEARIDDTARLLRSYVDGHWTPALRERFDAAYTSTPHGGRLDLTAIRDAAPVMQTALARTLLRRACPEAAHTQAVAEAVADLTDAQVGRRVEAGAATVWRTRTHLEVVADPPTLLDPQPVSLAGPPVQLPTGTLHCAETDVPEQRTLRESSNIAYVDAAQWHPPVTVRPWRKGDRLQPLGMTGHKSVSDLLTDAKVPPHRRAEQLVVVDAEHILWVVGHRIHHAVRVTASTNRVVQMRWKPRPNAGE